MPSLIEGRRLASHTGTARPPVRRGLIRRGGLFKRMSAADVGGVTLVCAPAGSGKTVLVRSWIDTTGLLERTGWVSVHRGEREAQRFWLSLIDALAEVLCVVQRVDPAPGFRGEAVVEQLLADLGSLEEPAILVIDDLHELHSRDALAWLERFLGQLPPALQVVLTTREDPRLGLHRLRLSGELAELRAADLRFSLDETREVLRASGITLSDAGVVLVHERTEGWAAGVRLAAISLDRHPDPERFVTEFSGSERNVAGYLVAEVLERQPADVRDMLLRTSVLEWVSGALADFLTGGSGAERTFQELEDANAFVTSLDAGRSLFRYHHLFADLLQLELRRTAPAIVAPLHRAAAEWLEQEGYVVEAIRHAQAARDWSLASRMLVDNYLDLMLDGRMGTVWELLSAFPDDATTANPELALAYATVKLNQRDLDQCDGYIALAQRREDTVPNDRRRRFDVLLLELRQSLARRRDDLETVLEATQAVEAALAAQPAEERAFSDLHRSIALENLGVAELWSTRFDDARRHLEQALALAHAAGRSWLEIIDLGYLGVVGPWTGLSLVEGLELCEQAVRIAESHGWAEDPNLVIALAAGARTLVWLGRFDKAEGWLERADRVLTPDVEPASELIFHHACGLLRLVQGRLADALTSLHAAQRMQGLLEERMPALLVSRHAFVLTARARLLQTQARMGELDAVRAALSGLSEAERNASEMRVTEATAELAHGEPARAIDVLAPVLEGVSPTIQRSAVRTEAQVLDALARAELGDRCAAEASIERALELAEPEGIVLPFILYPAQDLLDRLPQHRTAHATLRRTVLDVFAASAPHQGEPATLLDELSEAELRVVRYLPSNLRAPEIAAELFVSTNTIRTHLRHIYAKLGAHGRADAVERAREHGLLAPASRER